MLHFNNPKHFILIANFMQDVILYVDWYLVSDREYLKVQKRIKKCRYSLFNTTLFIISEAEYI